MMEVATLLRRFWGHLLDGLLLSWTASMLFLSSVLLGSATENVVLRGNVIGLVQWVQQNPFWNVFIPVSVVALTVILVVWWVRTLGRGQTPGKQMLGLQVRHMDYIGGTYAVGKPVGWSTMLARELIKGLLLATGIGYLIYVIFMIADSERHASLADRVMGTVVSNQFMAAITGEVSNPA